MIRSLFLLVAMLFFIPALSGCGGPDNSVVSGNDQASVEAEEAEAAETEEVGEEDISGARAALSEEQT